MAREYREKYGQFDNYLQEGSQRGDNESDYVGNEGDEEAPLAIEYRSDIHE